MPMPIRFDPCCTRRRALFVLLAGLSCATALAQGFPGGGPGGGRGGGRGGHGAPPDSAHRAAPADASKPPEPLASLLRSAHTLRQDLMLDATQTGRWAAMQDALRDALEKQRALHPKPADAAQVPNPALLFVEDAAAANGAYAAALEKASQSLRAAFDALGARQRKLAIERMSAALTDGAPP